MTSENQEAYRELIAANCWLVAAFAWKGYLDSGRGAVGVDCTTRAKAEETKIFYLDAQTIAVSQLKGLFVHEELLLREYNPEKTVVLIFVTSKDSITSCCWWPRPTPPEAYEQLKPRIDEFILSGLGDKR